MDADLAVRIRGLVVDRHGRRVLDGIDLDVPRGQVVGLFGPSGHGKTTLMRAIVGVQVVTAGAVQVLGAPAGAPSLRRRVAYMTQGLSIYVDLTVPENLAYYLWSAARRRRRPGGGDRAAGRPARPGGPAGRTAVRRAAGPRLAGRRPARRAGAARARRADRQDPLLREQLWRQFRRLANDGATLLVSSHVMDEAARCDQLVLLRDGRVLAAAPPDELRTRTGEQDKRLFLALIRT